MATVAWSVNETKLVPKAGGKPGETEKQKNKVDRRGELVQWVSTQSGVVGVVSCEGGFVPVPIESLRDLGVKTKA